ncbi:hypothetical protein MMC25_006789 [Agyrium rufum]|nr:hypothetical protein [Agyrium rufum]
MNARSLGDAARLSSSSSPLLTFLAPALVPKTPTWQVSTHRLVASTGVRRPLICQKPHNRPFSHSTGTRLAASAAAEAKQEEDEFPSFNKQITPETIPPPGISQHDVSPPIVQRFGTLNRQLPSNLPNSDPSNQATDSSHNPTPQDTKISHLIADVVNQNKRRNDQYEDSGLLLANAMRSDERSRSPLARRQGEIARQVLLPGSLDNSSTMARGIVRDLEAGKLVSKLPPPVRLDAHIGRAVNVDMSRGITVARAIQLMERGVRQNNIKIEERRQKFHERKGLKRKRLISERWRRRFKEGFESICFKVEGMRRKGW